MSRAGGVDYLIFGTLYRSASKSAPHRVATLDELSAVLSAQAFRSSRSGESRSSGRPRRLVPGPPVSPASGCSCRRQGRRPIAICKHRAELRRAFDTCGRFPNIDLRLRRRTRRTFRAKAGKHLMPQGPPARTVGARLREAREKRGVSLRQIATSTRISVMSLEALERSDLSRLPGGIFTRSFIRAYAQEVGLDPDRTIQDFIAELPPEAATATAHPAASRTAKNWRAIARL